MSKPNKVTKQRVSEAVKKLNNGNKQQRNVTTPNTGTKRVG